MWMFVSCLLLVCCLLLDMCCLVLFGVVVFVFLFCGLVDWYCCVCWFLRVVRCVSFVGGCLLVVICCCGWSLCVGCCWLRDDVGICMLLLFFCCALCLMSF